VIVNSGSTMVTIDRLSFKVVSGGCSFSALSVVFFWHRNQLGVKGENHVKASLFSGRVLE
jgi:hypothetical protein